MGNGYHSLVAAVLLVASFERTATQEEPCRSCPAGTFCGETKNPSCIRCPSDSFSSASGQKACDICRRCEGVFRTKRVCTPTSNAECECIPGFHCREPGCSMCEPDCKQGQGLTPHGCRDCYVGTFNDQKHGTCRPWTDCSSAGKTVLVNGTKESDVVCGPASADSPPGAPSTTVPAPAPGPGLRPTISIFFLALATTVALFLVFFFTIRFSAAARGRKKLLYIFKQPFVKAAQTAQEEDGCSCGFPEEEEGEEQKL